MKRTWIALACAALLAGGALYAESSSTLTVTPSEMKDGETKTFTDNGRTITVDRKGDTTTVRIEGADKTEKLTITRDGNRITIGRLDSDGARSLVIGPERRRIVIDGVPMDGFENLPRFHKFPAQKATTFFVCPKDQTTLRVPEEKSEETFKCPVDGTEMEKRKGRGFTFFFDDDSFDSNIL